MQKINFYTKDSKIIGVLTHKQDGNLFVQPSNPNIQFPTENSIIKIPIQNINAVRIFETEKETKIKAGNRTLGNIILIPSILVFAFSISASSSPEINLPWTNYVLSSIGIGVGLVIINNNKSKNYPTRYWRIY
jgi:hypothetical protein